MRLHAVIFYQAHLTEDERREKIENEEDACYDKNFVSAGIPGDLVGFYVVPFAHGQSSPAAASILKETDMGHGLTGKKNKTTKMRFVVEITAME